MTRFNINCDDVWKEVSGAKFVNMTFVNEYYFDSVRRSAELIQEAREILQGSAPFNLRQRRELESTVQILETQLVKERVVAKILDPRVSVYKCGSN